MLQTTINSKDLNNYLKVLGTVNKNLYEEYNLEIKEEYNQLTVTTQINNDKDLLSKTFDSLNNDNFNCRINSNDAKKYFSVLDSGNYTLTADNNKLEITSNNDKLTVNCTHEDLIEDKSNDKLNGGFDCKATEFIKMIEQLEKALATKETHLLSIRNLSMKIDFTNNSVEFASIDGYRLHTKKLFNLKTWTVETTDSKEPIKEKQILLSADTLKTLKSILKRIKTVQGKNNFNDLIHITYNDKEILVHSNGYLLETTNNFDSQDKFFDYPSIIPTNEDTSIFFTAFKEDLLKVLKKLNTIKNNGESLTKIDFIDKEVIFSSFNENVSMEVNFTDKAYNRAYNKKLDKVGFNTKYLIDAIEKIDTKEMIIISFTTEIRPIKIEWEEKNSEGTNVILPVNLNYR